MGTHESQRKPEEVEGEAKDYMRLIRPFVIGNNRDPRFILNMDQTPVFFSMNSKCTLELIGKKTIHIRTSTKHKAGYSGGDNCGGWYGAPVGRGV